MYKCTMQNKSNAQTTLQKMPNTASSATFIGVTIYLAILI